MNFSLELAIHIFAHGNCSYGRNRLFFMQSLTSEMKRLDVHKATTKTFEQLLSRLQMSWIEFELGLREEIEFWVRHGPCEQGLWRFGRPSIPIRLHSDSSKLQYGFELHGHLVSGVFGDEMKNFPNIAQREARAGTLAISAWVASRKESMGGEIVILDMDNKQIADTWRKRRSKDSFINSEFKKWLRMSESHNFEIICSATYSENQAADSPSRFQFWNKSSEMSFKGVFFETRSRALLTL